MLDGTVTGATTRLRAIATVTLGALVGLAALVAAPQADAAKERGIPVKVMTRNIFLGADLTPALNADNFFEFTDANGEILREVDETDFHRRSIGLAREINRKRPHLIGLQEVAWWRTNDTPGPPAQGSDPNPQFTAFDTRYNFLAILRQRLRNMGLDYRIAVNKTEFDFEAPADYDQNPATGLFGGEIQGRLTMRDVILYKADSPRRLRLRNRQSGTFEHLYTPNVSGIEVPVTRGWTAADVTVFKGRGANRQSASFRFVNSHFEAFDDEQEKPSIRALQAQELVEGPASPRRTIILGDFNSDSATEVQPGDAQAYQRLVAAGFRDRTVWQSTHSCCVSNLFTSPPSEFDHRVDHVMTNMRRQARLLGGAVVGREQVWRIYPSDHSGVFSKLLIR